jgi:hypothetical protein
MTEQEVADRTWEVENASTLNYTATLGTIPPVVSDVKIYTFDTIVQDTSPISVDLANHWIDIASGNNGKYRAGLQGDVLARNVSGATITQTLKLSIDIKRDRIGTITTLDNVEVEFSFAATPNNGTITKALNFGSVEFDVQVGDLIYIEFVWYNTIRNATDFEIDFLPNFEYSFINEHSYQIRRPQRRIL